MSNIDVPVGESVITFKFAKTGSNKGMGTLYINETKVGETAIENTLPLNYLLKVLMWARIPNIQSAQPMQIKVNLNSKVN